MRRYLVPTSPLFRFYKHKYLAELIGTASLTLAVLVASSCNPPLPVPVIAALTLGVFVYTIGGISGCHINPAITIGLWSINKISVEEAIKYIIFQVAGAALALLIASMYITPKFATATDTFPAAIAEILGTFFLSFGVASVVYIKVSSYLSGAVIGASLLLGIIVASATSNGVLNPAVAIGIGSWSVIYFIAPIIGSILGMLTFSFIMEKDRD